MEKYLTVKEICNKMSLNRMTVQTLIRKGKLPAYKVGAQYRISLSEFESFMNKNRVHA